MSPIDLASPSGPLLGIPKMNSPLRFATAFFDGVNNRLYYSWNNTVYTAETSPGDPTVIFNRIQLSNSRTLTDSSWDCSAWGGGGNGKCFLGAYHWTSSDYDRWYPAWGDYSGWSEFGLLWGSTFGVSLV